MRLPPSSHAAADVASFNYCFADFQLTPSPFLLRCRGEKVLLQPQPARLLVLLIERRSEIVSREEIRQEIWPGDLYLDHEQAINFAIRKVRIALGDSAKSPRFIETIPRLGYRFVATVENASTVETVEGESMDDAAQNRGSNDENWGHRASNGVAPADHIRATPWLWALTSAALFTAAT